MKQIRLQNFRCYTDLTVNLKPGINLFIGDNASGKTTLLKACRYVLSAFFAGYSDEHTRCVSPGDDDFSVILKGDAIQSEKSITISFVPNPLQYDAIEGMNNVPGTDGEQYDIRKNSKKNSRMLLDGIRNYRDYAHKVMSTDAALPLFASFSTEDIHSIRKINAEKFKAYYQKASFGYYECLDGDGFLRYWLKRLLILQEGQKNLRELEVVRTSIIRALGVEGCGIIQDMFVRPLQKKVYFQLIDGREIDAEHLSDGYRRLVNIVMDIAFRSVLLNGRLYGSESAVRTHGTVLVDEIDMHLHPSLQSTVLQGLRHAFPYIQFIVSTHAPMVMSNIKNSNDDVVYLLDYKDGQYAIHNRQTYGLDASTIMQVVLNQTPRNKEVDEQLKTLFGKIDNGQYEDARTQFEQLKETFGDTLPELAEVEAILNFSVINDEENK